MARPIKATPVLTEEQYAELCDELERNNNAEVIIPRITLSEEEINDILSRRDMV